MNKQMDMFTGSYLLCASKCIRRKEFGIDSEHPPLSRVAAFKMVESFKIHFINAFPLLYRQSLLRSYFIYVICMCIKNPIVKRASGC
jgi:hypothetical protein